MPIDDLTALGQKMREARKNKELTQQELSDLSHVSVKQIANIEKGKMNPSYLILRALAKVLHITVNYMMAKDSVQKRLNGEARDGLSFTEFTYQLLQGYDFLYQYEKYGVRLQLGGNDQWGNMTTGTELIHRTLGNDAERCRRRVPT